MPEQCAFEISEYSRRFTSVITPPQYKKGRGVSTCSPPAGTKPKLALRGRSTILAQLLRPQNSAPNAQKAAPSSSKVLHQNFGAAGSLLGYVFKSDSRN